MFKNVNQGFGKCWMCIEKVLTICPKILLLNVENVNQEFAKILNVHIKNVDHLLENVNLVFEKY